MTREEAIEILKGVQDNYKSDDGYDYSTDEYQEIVDAFDMAIEALKTEPCEDAVSREDVLNLPRKMLKNYFGEEVGEVVWVKDIESLPSVTPNQRTGEWIEFRHEEWANNIYIKCSECGKIYHRDEKEFNFCPHCGAKMEGESE